MAEADEATNELIARILAGDNDQYGYDDIGNGEASDDSDYGGPKKKKPKRGGKSQAKQQAASRPSTERTERAERRTVTGEDGDELTATGRRKRKDTGAKREGAAKGWTEEEERLFLEGLELYGREWHKAAAHVGTRDKKAFTSHAQKHFIKLCIADKPLPLRVVETGSGDGMGYTLSGLPLDPNSSSARSYGFKPEHLERLLRSGGPGVKGLLVPGKENQGGDNAATQTSGQAGVDRKEADAVAPGEPASGQVPPLQQQKLSKAPRAKKLEATPREAAVEETPKSPQEPTEYMKNRPRREGAGMRSKWGDTSESLELVTCSEFMGPRGSGSSLAQPFEVTVEGQVNLIMDMHAHLCACEIIGLLGGRWEASSRRLSVVAAFPCTRLAGSHSGTSVEVDPEAQVAALHQMEQQGLISVGWYHSHPIFAPMPSQKDNENQRNQQAMHRCPETTLEPCVGAIVGPYDTTLPSEASIITWFVVQSRSAQLLPFRVRLSDPTPAARPTAELEAALKLLVEAAASDPDRVDLLKEWRPFRLLEDGQPKGGRLSHLAKMRLAVSRHFAGPGADSEAAAALLGRLFAHLRATWDLEPQQEKEKQPAAPEDAEKEAVEAQ